MKGYDWRTVLALICPDYAIDTDNDGQIIIYTSLIEIDDDIYVSMTEDDRDGE
jgi:hypothetical protein